MFSFYLGKESLQGVLSLLWVSAKCFGKDVSSRCSMSAMDGVFL